MSRNAPVGRERVPERRAARRLTQGVTETASRSPRGEDPETRAHEARHGIAEAASPCFGPVSPLGRASQKANRDDKAQDQLSRSDARRDESRAYGPDDLQHGGNSSLAGFQLGYLARSNRPQRGPTKPQ